MGELALHGVGIESFDLGRDRRKIDDPEDAAASDTGEPGWIEKHMGGPGGGRKRPRDPNDVFLKQAASKVEVQLGRLGVSKSGNVFISAFITNKNDFALQQITLRCDYNTKDWTEGHFVRAVRSN
jgi:hypothetical protein